MVTKISSVFLGSPNIQIVREIRRRRQLCELRLFAVPPEYGNVYGGGQYSRYSSVIITAEPAVSCVFVTWSDGSKDKSRRICVTYHMDLSAFFDDGTGEILFNPYEQ